MSQRDWFIQPDNMNMVLNTAADAMTLKDDLSMLITYMFHKARN